MPDAPRHSRAIRSISELVTIGVLQAMKPVSQRAFYPWLRDNYGHRFPQLPERTRLGRRRRTHHCWTGYFLTQPTLRGLADSYGVALRHPLREGRRPGAIGKKGLSNHRWIIGGQLGVALNKLGLITDWDCATAKAPDQTFPPLLANYDGQMVVLTDRHRISCCQRQPSQREVLPSRGMERADASGDHLCHDDGSVEH